MAKQRHIGAILTLKDNMSATLKGVRREQSKFKKDVENTRKHLERTYKHKYKLRLEHTAAMKKIKETSKALEPLRKRVVTVLAYKDMITKRIRENHNRLKAFGKMVFKPVVTLKDKTASVLGNIKSKVLSLNTLIAGAATGFGVSKMVGSGANLEQQMISMEHFIGVQNKGMSTGDVKKQRDDYIKQLRENANVTPFQTDEVIAAGTRALNIAGGNTGSAMELVKLAEDMAALNPEKTLADAIEALADMRVGETERMKEFGFKISQEDINAAGGVDNIINQQLKPFFEGGAEKLATSGSGLWSTIKGKLMSKVQDTGLNILEKLKPHLEAGIELLDRFSPTLDLWASKVGSAVGWALEKFGSFASWIGSYMPIVREVISGVAGWISEKFGWIRGETGSLKSTFSSVFSGIVTVLQTGWKIMKPIFDLIAGGVRVLYEVFQFVFPYIRGIVSGVWDFVAPILEKLGDALGWVADKAGKIAEWLGLKVSEHDEMKASGTETAKVDGSHASGLSYVPYDGYIAELHRGEAVVPASRNPYNKSSNTVTNNKQQTVNVYVYADGKSTDEIINEFVPRLKLAMSNM